MIRTITLKYLCFTLLILHVSLRLAGQAEYISPIPDRYGAPVLFDIHFSYGETTHHEEFLRNNYAISQDRNKRIKNDPFSIITITEYSYFSQSDSVPESKKVEAYNATGLISKETDYIWYVSQEEWIKERDEEWFYDTHGNDTLFVLSEWRYAGNSIVQVDGYKRVVKYDDQNRMTLMALYYWDQDENGWKGSEKYETEYNEMGNLTVERMFRWMESSSEWLEVSRQIFEYDAQDHMVVEAIYDWDPDMNDWRGICKYTYENDALGRDTLTIGHYWNVDTWDWVSITKREDQYDSIANSLTTIYYEWDSTGNDWKLSSKYERFFDEFDQDTLGISYSFDHISQSWMYEVKLVQTYDPTNRISTYEGYYWDDLHNAWIGSSMYEWQVDEYGAIILSISYEWDTLLFDWYIYSGHFRERTYDVSGKEIEEISYSWDKDLSIWIPGSKVMWYYNKDDQLNIEVYFEWNSDSSEWELIHKRFFTYRQGYITRVPKLIPETIFLFPNPVHSDLYITGLKEPVKCSIYTIQGKLVMEKTVLSQSIDLSTLSPGIHIVILRKDGKPIHNCKILKK